MKETTKYGFSLVEIMLVVGIMAVIATIIIFSFSALNKNYNLEGAAQNGATMFKDARGRTLSAQNNSQYGIHIASSSLTLFPGSIFVSGNSSNETLIFSQSVAVGTTTLSGVGFDIIFSRLKGTPSQFGTTSVYLVNNPSKYKNIIIRESGLIEIK